ncbi:MAG: alkaline phosphatase family protein [Acidobacteriaceae bacterium]
MVATNAEGVTVTGSDGSRYTLTSSGGSQTVSPTSTTTYTATAAGTSGSATGTATVTVTAASSTQPTVTLTASPTSIASGGSATLAWTSANATSVSISPAVGTGTLALSGSATVSPTSTTTYTITATGSGGTATATATVTLTAAPVAPTVTLAANPTTITTGGSSTLTWTSTNATSVSISPAVGTGVLAVNGSVTVSPTSTTTYTITATGAGGTATATATVSVGAVGAVQSPITHLIVLILQNHSFDNMFGTFPGANGLNPSLPSYTQVDAAGNTVTPELMTQLDAPDINHNIATYTAAWDNGKMDKYASTNGDISMDYYDNTVSGTASDGTTWGIDTVWGYADQYALADNFFSSTLYSEPGQMLYMTAATTHDARTAGSLPYNDNCNAQQLAEGGGTIAVPLTETNVGNQMTTAGVSWTWYQTNYATSVDGTCVNYVPQENPFQYFTSTNYGPNLADVSLASFEAELTNGTLPSVSFVTPAPGVSEHPGSGHMADGIEWADEFIQQVKNSSYWSSTAIVMLYDESGGWYDHVSPPQLPNSFGLGARVPVIVISPYAKTGYISHQQMDYVSILRFIQWNWNLGLLPAADQQAREQQSGDLCDLLTTPCGAP